QYPNFAQLDTIQQNQLSLGLSMPLLDWGMVSKDARSKRHRAASAANELLETKTQLARALGEARDRAALLEKQRISAASAAVDAAEAARLVYDAYLAGEVIFLEVQRANFRALSARVEAARTDSKLLVELARLENLLTKPQTETEQ
ncbi:MAG TPA: TolC family protein, partial [bacterium]|nr:TolC family protein [bacterium]